MPGLSLNQQCQRTEGVFLIAKELTEFVAAALQGSSRRPQTDLLLGWEINTSSSPRLDSSAFVLCVWTFQLLLSFYLHGMATEMIRTITASLERRQSLSVTYERLLLCRGVDVLDVELTRQLPVNCTDSPWLANCELLVQARLCSHPYYRVFCCRSCWEAGKLGL